MAANRDLYIGPNPGPDHSGRRRASARIKAKRAEVDAKLMADPDVPKPVPEEDARARWEADARVAYENLVEILTSRPVARQHLRHDLDKLVRRWIESPDMHGDLPAIVRTIPEAPQVVRRILV